MASKILHLTTLSLILFSCQQNNCAQTTMKVNGRFLYDACGKKVVLRGINEMFIWSKTDSLGKLTFPEIKKTGANVVRIVWSTKGSVAGLDAVITNCIENQMIPMPELHDATGDLDKVPEMVEYWISPAVMKAINKHQKYLLLNIANEAGNYAVGQGQFQNVYAAAIKKIRNAGIHVPLVIDAPDWGKNIDILQAAGANLIAQDADKNLLFSVHIWWANEDGSTLRIINELQQSADMSLPLIVGE